VVKDDEGPGLRLEATEATFELVAVDHDGVGVVEVRVIDRGQVDVEAVPPEAARLVDAGSVEQSVQPRVEPIGAAEGRQIAPGSDERLLDGVLGLVGVAEDQAGSGIEPEDRGSCKPGEGVMIAPSCPFHEILLHVAPRRRTRDERAR